MGGQAPRRSGGLCPQGRAVSRSGSARTGDASSDICPGGSTGRSGLRGPVRRRPRGVGLRGCRAGEGAGRPTAGAAGQGAAPQAGDRPAPAARGAWGRRLSLPSARALLPVRAASVPTPSLRALPHTRAAGNTRARRRRSAYTPHAQAPKSGRGRLDTPQAPGGQGAPSVAPGRSRVF